jgi:hypothetical protein
MRTVKVRIAVAVNKAGEWCANGWFNWKDESAQSAAVEGLDSALPEVVHFVEAEIPLPESETINGEVSDPTWADCEFIAASRNRVHFEMKYVLYATPYGDENRGILFWQPRMMGGVDLPLTFFEEPHRGKFSDPVTAVCTAGEWLDKQGDRQ